MFLTFIYIHRAKDYYNSVSFTVFAATWNVAGSNTVIEKSDILQLLFGDDMESNVTQSDLDQNLSSQPSLSTAPPKNSGTKDPLADIYCIAFQETVDLSTMNVVFDDSKAIERSHYLADLVEAVLRSKNQEYKKISMKHLVGMLILVFVKDELCPYVNDVRESSIGVGVMGVMGNKGAVAIRLSLHDTSICFVASHFTANKKEVQSRNQDFQVILDKLVFQRPRNMIYEQEDTDDYKLDMNDNYLNTSTNRNKTWQDLRFFWNKDLKILDHSQIFWLGDLNYRIDGVNYEDIIGMIESNCIQSLLEYDQLSVEKRKGNIFQDFTEGRINFLPTYKYQPGSSLYENRPGKKQREPAWCDRIMFSSRKGSQICLNYYDRAELLPSDHKPVIAFFSSSCNKVNLQDEKNVYIEIVRLVDKWENDNAPKVEVVEKFIDFPSVRYEIETSSSIQVINKGPSAARWRFLKKVVGNDHEIGLICKPWLKVEPFLGVLYPGETVNVQISVSIDKFNAKNIRDGVDSLDDILVLHVEDGCDFFISITGNFDFNSMNDDNAFTDNAFTEAENMVNTTSAANETGSHYMGDFSNNANQIADSDVDKVLSDLRVDDLDGIIVTNNFVRMNSEDGKNHSKVLDIKPDLSCKDEWDEIVNMPRDGVNNDSSNFIHADYNRAVDNVDVEIL